MNFIVAVDNNYAIGLNNDLLYDLPADLKYFKKVTQGKVVVMGERTFISLPYSRPLKNRNNIILSNNKNLVVNNAVVVNSFSHLAKELKKYNTDDVFIIGGASVYNSLIPYCKKAYITKINSSTPADTFITNIETLDNWKLVSQSQLQTQNNLSFEYRIYENIKVKPFDF
jgi:dihydrofolate reductase